MKKTQIRKATFKDLIAKKIAREESKFKIKEIYVTSMGCSLVFKKPSDDLVLDIIEEIEDGKDTKKIISAYKKLAYLCCDMLQDVELHKELEVIDPFDVIDKLFDLADIMEIGEQLMELIDINGKNSEIKNS